tara:strand:+ start:336 stop:509 length:174 start_codon:yes stop_codon:yes gene_type:complete
MRGLGGHGSPVNTVAMSHDGSYVVSGGDEGKVLLYGADTYAKVCEEDNLLEFNIIAT